MAHESTVCLDSFSASQTTFNDQFRKSPRKAEASSFSPPAKNNQNRPTAFALKSAGNSQPQAFLPYLNAKKLSMGFA
jgi:hypothetical protein